MSLFSIEGNIGAGKSTILQHLKEFLNTVGGRSVVYIDEPVDEWNSIRSEDDKSMLTLFYENPTKYAFAFQMMAYISRLSSIRRAMHENPGCIYITERCLLSDFHVFATMLYEQKHISKEEYTIYTKWFDQFTEDVQLTGIIYLKCSPDIALSRCTKRNRPGESITLDYLNNCHAKHTEWLTNESISVLTLNNDHIDIDDALFEIEDFIQDEIIDNEITKLNDKINIGINKWYILLLVSAVIVTLPWRL
jgi:deoxyadenosine/deoxycytidine kinase